LLQKHYQKLLIKLGTDFEVRQKRKTVPFHLTFGTNNLEMIPKFKHFRWLPDGAGITLGVMGSAVAGSSTPSKLTEESG
jgi:hypothetical protein